ncbi:MAG: hypothetical protein ACLSHC_14480 [Bilophila wadsworthia]
MPCASILCCRSRYPIAEDRSAGTGSRRAAGAVPVRADSHDRAPATDDVLSLILRIYRRDSELDKMLFDRAVPCSTWAA